ncbi:unnamed protein product, partial [marine sediment metagenome]
MKTDGNDSIHIKKGSVVSSHNGLTKREYFAAMALQGFCVSGGVPIYMANAAVRTADALIEELNKDE